MRENSYHYRIGHVDQLNGLSLGYCIINMHGKIRDTSKLEGKGCSIIS